MKLILLSMSNMPRWFLTIFFLGFCNNVLAERCEPQENNEYEKILCQLKQSGRGAGLPNIFQFRENSPLVQALLLKKPAERAGIIVKIPERDNQETLRRQEELLVAVPAAQSAEPVHLNSAVTTVKVIQQAPASVVSSPIISQPVVASTETISKVETIEATPLVKAAVTEKEDTVSDTVEKNAGTSLASCTLQQLTLQCAGGQYQLLGNKTNQQLPADALAEDHKLALPVYTGTADDVVAIDNYLAKAYDRYLAGMTEIGLGASTMSYTKFANLYHYIVGQNLDFSGRFETMYQFLKKDKAAIGVSTKLSVAAGFTPESCNELENFIVCDYKSVNYVFTKVNN